MSIIYVPLKTKNIAFQSRVLSEETTYFSFTGVKVNAE